MVTALVKNVQFLKCETFEPCLNALALFTKPNYPSSLSIAAMKSIFHPSFLRFLFPLFFLVSLQYRISMTNPIGMDYMFSRVLDLLGLSAQEDAADAEGGPLLRSSSGGVPSQSHKFLELAKKRKRDEKKKEAWSKYWLPIFHQFTLLCRDGRSDVRNNAMTHLQRSLLSPHLDILTPQGWFICFEEVSISCFTYIHTYIQYLHPTNLSNLWMYLHQ